MHRVIRVMAFRGIKRHPYMAVMANTGQSPNSVLMLGQDQIRLTGIEPTMGCDAGSTLNRYLVGGPTLCVPGTASIAWMLASTGDGGGKNRPTR